MGSSPSQSSRTPINDRSSSQVSPAPTHTIGSIDEEESSSRFLQEPIGSSNLSAEKTADQKHTEKKARWQAEINVKEYLELLNEETNQEETLTNQEILSRKNSLFRFLNKQIDTIRKLLSSANEDEQQRNELCTPFLLLASFVSAVKKIGPLPVDDLNKCRREAGQQLSETKSVQVICKVITEEWQQLVCNDVKLPSNIMLTAMLVLWNFSDCSPEVTYDIIAEFTFLKTLQEILTSYHHERIQGVTMVNSPYEVHVKVNIS